MKSESIKTVLGKHKDELMSIPGVVGTAEGLYKNKPCIKVFVVNNTPEIEEFLPKVLEGFVVVLEKTGKFEASFEKKNQNY